MINHSLLSLLFSLVLPPFPSLPPPLLISTVSSWFPPPFSLPPPLPISSVSSWFSPPPHLLSSASSTYLHCFSNTMTLFISIFTAFYTFLKARFMIIIKVFIKHQILSIETILNAYTHRHTCTHKYTNHTKLN